MLCTYDKFYLQLSRYFFSIVYVCIPGGDIKGNCGNNNLEKSQVKVAMTKRFKVFMSTMA